MGLDGDLGSLEAGKMADLIFFDPSNNPLENINFSRDVEYVMLDGRLYNAQTMDQILPFPQTLPQGPVLNTPSIV